MFKAADLCGEELMVRIVQGDRREPDVLRRLVLRM